MLLTPIFLDRLPPARCGQLNAQGVLMAVFTAPRPVFAKANGKSHMKPRNPFVAPSLFRNAGSHGKAVQAQRQEAQRALKRELKQLASPADDNGP
jgi:hypothetical protein